MKLQFKPIGMPHTHKKISRFTIHTYNNGGSVTYFKDSISEKAIRVIARCKSLRAISCNSSFTSSHEKTNVLEIFKLRAPSTNVKVI